MKLFKHTDLLAAVLFFTLIFYSYGEKNFSKESGDLIYLF